MLTETFIPCSSVSDLIGRNADYLVHATSIHLRHAPHRNAGHAEAIQVLGAVTRHGNEEVCHMMKDCVDELLVSLDTRQLPANLVWAGLQTLAESCEHWISKRKKVEHEQPGGVVQEGVAADEDGDPEVKKVGIQAIADYFLEYHKQKDKQEQEEWAGLTEEQANEEEEESYARDRPLPAAEQICVEMMRRCCHHLSHDTPNIRMVVMETLQHCMKALRHDTVSDNIKHDG